MHDFPLLTTIAAGFAAAWVLGLITQRIGLSPIVGYLLAGVAIGPHTAGFVGDKDIALQLAEIGVILMMFGVGLHFHLKDLIAVRNVAVPGAIVQSVVATLLTMLVFHYFGWSMRASATLGMAMAVASTVVLLRVLMDRNILNTSHGHIAVGWLIVEDIATVLALVLVPIMAGQASPAAAGGAASSGFVTVGWAVLKLVGLVLVVLVAGSKVFPWVLKQVAKVRSAELFTLTILTMSIAVAVGSAALFGASVALGAFLAGMVVSQSPVSHQAASNVLPMRDAFSVMFFVSVGMLFDPEFVLREPLMVVAALGIVLIAKPLAALAVVAVIGRPVRTGLTVALGLAQIGEFSFILGQLATDHKLLPEAGMQVLVAAAMISITLNPLLFGLIEPTERVLRRMGPVWWLLTARAERRSKVVNASSAATLAASQAPLAIIVGHGPVGRLVDALLRDAGLRTVVVDMNIETVETLAKRGHIAIFGDATQPEVLEQTGIREAVHLIVTLPDSGQRIEMVRAARRLNPTMEITVRAHYLTEHDALLHAGATRVVYEEGEAGVALARHVLERRGVEAATIAKLLGAIRKVWKMDP